jgi:hypothetical protein
MASKLILARAAMIAALLLVRSTSADVLPDNRADVFWSKYSGGGMDITGYSATARAKITENFAVEANYFIDKVSGTLPRRESLVVAGREAVQLVLGCVPMLFIAGIIEAFLSPTELSAGMKFLFAASVLILLAAYLSGVTVKRVTTADSDA